MFIQTPQTFWPCFEFVDGLMEPSIVLTRSLWAFVFRTCAVNSFAWSGREEYHWVGLSAILTLFPRLNVGTITADPMLKTPVEPFSSSSPMHSQFPRDRISESGRAWFASGSLTSSGKQNARSFVQKSVEHTSGRIPKPWYQLRDTASLPRQAPNWDASSNDLRPTWYRKQWTYRRNSKFTLLYGKSTKLVHQLRILYVYSFEVYRDI